MKLYLKMTRFQANFIKLLRVRWGYSWRAVHRNWQIRYVPKEQWWFNSSIVEAHGKFPELIGEFDKKTPHGHQIRRMDLCEEAINYLGEDVEDGWN